MKKVFAPAVAAALFAQSALANTTVTQPVQLPGDGTTNFYYDSDGTAFRHSSDYGTGRPR
jgi:hypothetical protein